MSSKASALQPASSVPSKAAPPPLASSSSSVESCSVVDESGEQLRIKSGDVSVLSYLAISSFSKFLSSSAYLEWRARESAGVCAIKANMIVEQTSRKSHRSNAAVHPYPSSSRTPSSSSAHHDVVDKADSSDVMHFLQHCSLPNAEQIFIGMNRTEFWRIANSSSWLTALLTSMENLPVAFALCSAVPKKRGCFPITYVNKEFESLTGYSRAEVMGKTCKFLQREGVTDPVDVANITVALRSSKPIRITVQNVRKNGSTFQNRLTMKPIFDQFGVNRYYIGLMCDIARTPRGGIGGVGGGVGGGTGGVGGGVGGAVNVPKLALGRSSSGDNTGSTVGASADPGAAVSASGGGVGTGSESGGESANWSGGETAGPSSSSSSSANSGDVLCGVGGCLPPPSDSALMSGPGNDLGGGANCCVDSSTDCSLFKATTKAGYSSSSKARVMLNDKLIDLLPDQIFTTEGDWLT